MKYLTSDDYPKACDRCKHAIDMAHQLIVDGLVSDEYSDDNEGPCMLAYDRGWLSDDSRCCD
jgi:hypothetical protein